MYCIDTLNRLNDEAVAKHEAEVEAGNETCDYCDEPATHLVPVYNPADSVRDVDGAYATYSLCDEHFDNQAHLEENFYCDGCGELFINNHSWDFLRCDLEDGSYCHACAAEQIEPIPWSELKSLLREGDTQDFVRLDSLPGKKLVWEGEYSGYSDFPGHTSIDSIIAAVIEAGVSGDDLVYPLLTKTYQFAVVIAIYK